MRTKEQSAAFLLGIMQVQSDRLALLLHDPRPATDKWSEDVNVLVVQLGATWERVKHLGLSVVPEPRR